MFFKIGVLKNFANFNEKYLYWKLFLLLFSMEEQNDPLTSFFPATSRNVGNIS